MASGLIYLIIIGMWIAYFLPRWLTHHHESSGRNAERYKTAIKAVTEKEGVTEVAQDPEKKFKVMARRRQIFSALAGATLVTLIIAGFGLLPISTLTIPLSAMGIYTVNVRRQVLASQAKIRKLRALQQIAAATIPLEPVEKISFARQSVAPSDNWIPLSDRLDSAGVVVIPRESNSWQPIAVPKPTYISAPKAITPKRLIDLTVPGEWSAEQAKFYEALMPSRDEVFDQELVEQAARPHDELDANEQSRAVNN